MYTYQVERHGSDYAVYNDAGTVATCGNPDDARRIARALNLEAAMGEVRVQLAEAIDILEDEGYPVTKKRQAIAALDRAGEV